jgi:dUTP pyrophosphatase
MNIRIKRFDKELPLPEYKTVGAAALDLASRIDVTILPKTIAYVPLNVAIEPPAGHFVFLAARSSLHKKGLIPANGIGIIDPDYSGDEDEYKAALYNFSDTDVTILRGERIMQIVITPFAHVDLKEVDDMEKDSRGGFGTTGAL